jgi:DNA-binding transcriptional LysR family regulator
MDGIENLRTFVAVADAGSLAAAARRLDIVASVVTKRIDQLESRVGTRLFKRSTKRVTLTEFGARYLPQARRLIFDYDQVFAEMSHSPRQVEGHIRIRVPTPMAIGFMAEALAKFQRQYPRVSLDVVLQDSGKAVSPSEEGFDMAITGAARTFPGAIDETICPLHKWVCAAPAYLEKRGAPQHPRELARHDCLLFESLGRTWQFESATGPPVFVDVRPKLSANDQFVLKVAALRANGIALLPSYAVSTALRAGTLVRVLPRFTVPSHWLKAAVPESRAGTPQVQSLVAFLKARYAPIPPWDRES